MLKSTSIFSPFLDIEKFALTFILNMSHWFCFLNLVNLFLLLQVSQIIQSNFLLKNNELK